jgi:hypothetical protein
MVFASDVWGVTAHCQPRHNASKLSACRQPVETFLRPHPGVAWVSKRLGSAQALQMDTSDWQRLAITMKQGLNSFTSLQKLEFHSTSLPLQFLDASPATLAHTMSLLWLLASLPKLRVLHVNVEKFPWFPPFSRLKHLILSFDKDTGNVFEYLPNSEVLETLSLEVSDAVFEAPALQLESLRCLRAVALDGIRPASICLPNSCSLHLINLEVADMATAHWDSVLLKVITFQLQQLLLKVPNMLPTLPNCRM